MTEPFRNPIILPKTEPKGRTCEKCGSAQWTGRNVQGVVTFTCKDCRHQWQGGLPQVPEDRTRPMPQTNYRPVVDYSAIRNSKGEVINVEEIVRRPEMAQPFRKGAPIPEDEEF